LLGSGTLAMYYQQEAGNQEPVNAGREYTPDPAPGKKQWHVFF
jgi:hypothetical protein